MSQYIHRPRGQNDSLVPGRNPGMRLFLLVNYEILGRMPGILI